MSNFSLSTIAVAGLCMSSAQAVTLALYEFTDNAIEESPTDLNDLSVTSTATGVSASDFTSPVFDFAVTTANAFTSNGLGLATGTDDNMAGAITANQYMSFTISADSGTISMDTLSFDIARAQRGAQDFQVRASFDGFTNFIEVSGFQNQAIAQDTFTNYSFDLTDSGFDVVTSVEFRIYLDDRAGNQNSSSGTYIDNVVISAVPEPSSTALLGLGGLALILRRRK
ncbi:PEP-CTERM sorting domain-containing protein [Rubritalea spongiae]|uniref:PEP-CTERM sorting domain-containing protein n=1 Tax=Rubritalea spongiae TaxID=430797 RepID=A0ABW5DZC2_9BACT